MNALNFSLLRTTLISCLIILAVAASAQDEVIVKGVIKSVDLETKTIVVSSYDGKNTLIVLDDAAVEKFRKKSIEKDDEVSVKCVKTNGGLKSISFFKKPPG